LTLAAVGVATVVAMWTSEAPAYATSTANVCSLVSEGKLASVHVNQTCVALEPLSSPSGTIARGTWGSLLHPGKNGSLGVNVTTVSPSVYTEIVAADKARPHTSVGIGDWSMSNGLVNGKKGAIVEFAIHDDLVVIIVNAGKPLGSIGPVLSLARAVAKAL
jgi:hypothetical protein